ncbi:hypothetical protein ACFE04_003283 [Oxalis oulophora]
MLDNPSPVAPPDSVKRYAPPNQRNRSLNRRKSQGFDRPSFNEGDNRSSSSSFFSDHGIISLDGCCKSQAAQLLNDRWSATINRYNETSAESSERPVMYSGSNASAWTQFRLPHQMIPPPHSAPSPGLQLDFLNELRRAMHNASPSSGY